MLTLLQGGILVVNNYGPYLYAGLGFPTPTQLLYGAAWLTFALGLDMISCFINDHVSRNKLMSVGVMGCKFRLRLLPPI